VGEGQGERGENDRFPLPRKRGKERNMSFYSLPFKSLPTKWF
jgi:hypothetical protein